ncbi:unnamed protein product [Brassicogethes aeneus]|uniref:Uncharacterized protein n=1 Tax=Brassicogethes aeneus TaxID=1431903 RepID=A0A9P0BC07_BRAAE|nr:unnamed protein product [Brassicogethes aeneus]
MKVFLVGAFLTVLCLTCCAQDDSETTEPVEDNPREMREYNNNDNWRALDDFPSQGNTGWIPHDSSQEPGEQLPKKRRLRKRKRRPPMISLTESEDGSNERIVIRKRIRPQRLDQIRESWKDTEEDIIRRPYVRRRVAPTYNHPPEEIIISGEQLNPLSATLQFQDETTQKQENEVIESKAKEEVNNDYEQPINPPEILPEPLDVEIKTHSTPDLKTLLKQSSGTLSLSELLQQKNLSLSELLTGNQKAISALTEPPQVSISPTESQTAAFKRVPPSVALKKTTNRVYEQSQESAEALTSRETFEAQRKRLALLNGFKEDHVYADVTKYEVVTEPATEKRIFVPSHPKYYTSLDYKPDLKQFEFNTEPYVETTTTTTTISDTTPKLFKQLDRINKIRFGFPKLSNISKESDSYPTLPPKPNKISLSEIFGVKEEKQDEPFRMAIDLGVTMKDESSSEEQFITTPPAEKLKYVTAKEEIMEILRDPNTRENLARILETRNMTLEELVEQRERGSSQLHLADIFHNKTREPEPLEEAFVGHVNENSPLQFLGRQQKSIEVLKPPKVEVKPKDEYLVTSFPTYKIASNKTIKDAFQWPDVYSSLFPKINQNINNKKPEIKTTTESYFDDDIQRLEEIENKLSSLSNDRFDVELKQNTFEQKSDESDDYFPLPSGVKSAIVASLAIIGGSLLVFVTILLIFKWSQKHKQRLNYCSSLTSRIKSPILENAPRRSIRSFMNETLGRQKNDYYNYNKSHIQSMSEQIWENDRKLSY